MTREDFENGLMARLADIRAFYKRYNPRTFEDGNKPFLSMTIYGERLQAFNRSYEVNENNPDREFVVNCWKEGNSPVFHS